MRITQTSLNDAFLLHLRRNSLALLRSQERVATQKRINRVSDNPIEATRLLDVKRTQSNLDQFLRNIDRVTSTTDIYDNVLAQAGELIVRAKELLLAEANEVTSTTQTREAARLEVAALTAQLVQLGNTRYNGNYVFSGFEVGTPAYSGATATSTPGGVLNGATIGAISVSDLGRVDFTTTYQITFDGAGNYDVIDNSTGGSVGAGTYDPAGTTIRFAGFEVIVSGGPPGASGTFDLTPVAPGVYNGDDGKQQIEIQSGTSVAQNVTGNEVFGAAAGIDVFGVMNEINNALRNNVRGALAPSIDTLLDGLDQAREQIINRRVAVGARQNMLETASARQEDIKFALELLRSELEDIDLAEAITDFNQRQLALESTIGSGALLLNISLLDFLR